MIRTASATRTWPMGTGAWVGPRTAAAPAADARCLPYQPPTRQSTTIAISAARENQATLRCPRGSTTKAAASGPTAEPALPPTWKSDCASPCCPPEAIRATREDSGWKTALPNPTIPADSSTIGKLPAAESRMSPTRVNVIPAMSEYGRGRWSV